MIQKKQTQSKFVDAISGHSIKNLASVHSDWLNKLGQKSLSRFQELGLPTSKNEEWKYTNLSSLEKNDFTPISNIPCSSNSLLKNYTNADEITIYFHNGIFSKEMSTINNLPKGICILPISQAITSHEAEIQKIYGLYEIEKLTPFISLNNALTSDGIFIQITSKTILNKNIHILNITSDIKNPAIITPKVIISMGQQAEGTIQETYVTADNSLNYVSATLTDIYIDEGSTLKYCRAQNESEKSVHIANTRVWIEQNSQFKGFSFLTGGSITRNNLDIVINGEGANATLDGLYSQFNEQHIDNHTSVDHRVPNCTSNQLYKGILNDSSRAVFNGKVFVRDIAQQTNSYQLNKNLLLGKECRVYTKPQLEIFADDVKCTHGATIGRLEENELFYLQSRGISRTEATKVLAKGFADEIINTVNNDIIIKRIQQLLSPSIEALSSN